MLKLFILVMAIDAPAGSGPVEIAYAPPEVIQYGDVNNPIAMPFEIRPEMCKGKFGLQIAQEWAMAHPGWIGVGTRCKTGAAATEKHA